MGQSREPRKPMWRSAAGLSAIAALVTAVVSAGGFAVSTFGGGDDDDVAVASPTPATSSSPSATGASEAAPGSDLAEPAEQVVYEDSLADRSVGWTILKGSDCFSRFGRTGFRIEVDTATPSICTVQATFLPTLVSLSDVRVEVEAEWVDLPADGDARGLGAAGLRCRGAGHAADGTFYSGVVSDEGWWSIDRWDGDQGDPDRTGPPSTVLAEGETPAAAWAPGDRVRIALECDEREDGLVLALSVDGRRVGAAVDRDPLPSGDVGLAAYSFVGPMEVEFRRFTVLELTDEPAR
jgi:hypothetical protein